MSTTLEFLVNKKMFEQCCYPKSRIETPAEITAKIFDKNSKHLIQSIQIEWLNYCSRIVVLITKYQQDISYILYEMSCRDFVYKTNILEPINFSVKSFDHQICKTKVSNDLTIITH